MTRQSSSLRRWIDAHLVGIGVAMLVSSLAVNALIAVYSATGPLTNDSLGPYLIAFMVAARLARAFIYLGGFLAGVGVLLRNWRVVLVGFENTEVKELIVDGPDADNTVWLGKRYASAFEAEAAFNALARRVVTERAKAAED